MPKIKIKKILNFNNGIYCIVSNTKKISEYLSNTILVFFKDDKIIKELLIPNLRDCANFENKICCVSYYGVVWQLDIKVIDTTDWNTTDEFSIGFWDDDLESIRMIDSITLCIYPQKYLVNLSSRKRITGRIVEDNIINNDGQLFQVTQNAVKINQSSRMFADITDIHLIFSFLLKNKKDKLSFIQYECNNLLITVNTRLWWLVVKAIQLLTNGSELRQGRKQDLELLISATFIESSDCYLTGAALMVFSSLDLTVLISRFL